MIDPRGCPSDAANWDSTAFSPKTRLYYFMALEECTGKPTGYPDQTGQRFLRAVNIETGEIAWEVPQPGPARAKTWSGVLATAGGLVFYGQPNGGFEAVDQRDGKTLWQFPTNVRMKASPMTFTQAASSTLRWRPDRIFSASVCESIGWPLTRGIGSNARAVREIAGPGR